MAVNSTFPQRRRSLYAYTNGQPFSAGMAVGGYLAIVEARWTSQKLDNIDIHKDCRQEIDDLTRQIGKLQKALHEEKASNWWQEGKTNQLGDCSY